MRWLLKRLSVHTNSYYNYLKYKKRDFHDKKAKILETIKKIYTENDGKPGHRMIMKLMEQNNIKLSKTTVHKYMNKELHLKSIIFRKKAGYKKGKPHKIFTNLLNRNFSAKMPGTIWCIDFTYMKLSNGKMRYNCSIIDLFDRSIVSSVNGSEITSELAIEAVKKALQHRRKIKLILHSDQGSQFTSKDFIEYCKSVKIKQSMSKAGCPYDNAVMERYFNTLKSELINLYTFKTNEELDNAIDYFAFVWYNWQRPHSYNGWIPPKRIKKCA